MGQPVFERQLLQGIPLSSSSHAQARIQQNNINFQPSPQSTSKSGGPKSVPNAALNMA